MFLENEQDEIRTPVEYSMRTFKGIPFPIATLQFYMPDRLLIGWHFFVCAALRHLEHICNSLLISSVLTYSVMSVRPPMSNTSGSQPIVPVLIAILYSLW